jgi:hypothetical protein
MVAQTRLSVTLYVHCLKFFSPTNAHFIEHGPDGPKHVAANAQMF